MDTSDVSGVISLADSSSNIQSSGSVISISSESSLQDKNNISYISLSSSDNKDNSNSNLLSKQKAEETGTESSLPKEPTIVESELIKSNLSIKDNSTDSVNDSKCSIDMFSDPSISSFCSDDKNGKQSKDLDEENNEQETSIGRFSSSHSGNIDIEGNSFESKGSSVSFDILQTDSKIVEPPSKRQKIDDDNNVPSCENNSSKPVHMEEHTWLEENKVAKGDVAENLSADVSHVSSIGSSVHEGEMAQPQDTVWDNDFLSSPMFLCEGRTDFASEKENFLKGCKWAPDGTCFVTNSEDNCLRVFNLPQQICQLGLENLPEMSTALKIREAELIYDYCWHPRMTPADPSTCCLFSTSRDAPVHMWDAFTGELVSTYKPHNHADELSAAHSLALSPDGKLLYCGFNKMIRVFDINRPGKLCQKRPTLVSTSGRKQKKKNSMKVGQSGIISCIDVNPAQPSMYAAGSYTRSIGLYTEPEGTMYCMFQGQAGGVTHLRFSPDGTKLYSGGRKDPELICWDVRNPGKILFILNREFTTNQRIYFDMDHTGQYVISGSQNGEVFVWDTLAPPCEDEDGEPLIKPLLKFKAHGDCVNGISLHPTMPLLATASGQRHFNIPSKTIDSDSEDDVEYTNNILKDCPNPDSTVKLWWVGKKNVMSNV